ncbi:hypothetical protein B0T10DRAFT_468128 [Thelonectria olida]|uniref:Uncharacterized protein n=1 Tax=Thelonectria olida TaxID=1576542 RepID=A0A9P8VNW3_9HYPO|nr:hypothetical protein B0T10DRAFT_468128 [Thelonectria olida]
MVEASQKGYVTHVQRRMNHPQHLAALDLVATTHASSAHQKALYRALPHAGEFQLLHSHLRDITLGESGLVQVLQGYAVEFSRGAIETVFEKRPSFLREIQFARVVDETCVAGQEFDWVRCLIGDLSAWGYTLDLADRDGKKRYSRLTQLRLSYAARSIPVCCRFGYSVSSEATSRLGAKDDEKLMGKDKALWVQ